MSTYAIGDIQGCRRSLAALLERIDFDSSHDRLWICGDLVNRGPDSLGVLRWAFENREAAVIVLGNHDLHLLARWRGVAPRRPMDTIDDVLDAPDRDELLGWLLTQPLLERRTLEPGSGRSESFLLLHAGILPHWSVEEARQRASQASEMLRSDRGERVLETLAARRPLAEPRRRDGVEAAAHTLQILTNLRVCGPDGEARLDFNGAPGDAGPDLVPWHEFPSRRDEDTTFVCGHWAAQGLELRPRLLALDSGCVWQGQLTAVRLEDREVFQVKCGDEA